MRFVRIYHHEKDDPGMRLRVDYDPDDTGAYCVVDECVLPEETLNPDCRRVTQIGNISLDDDAARWLRDALIDLCAQIDAERAVTP